MECIQSACLFLMGLFSNNHANISYIHLSDYPNRKVFRLNEKLYYLQITADNDAIASVFNMIFVLQ